jgi:HK97 family phage portal protein
MTNSFSVQQIPAYWRAIEFLSSNMASFPHDVHDGEAKATESHPLDKLLKRKSNSQQTSHAVLKCWYYHGEHFGNGYLYIRHDPITANVIGLYNLMPVDVIPYRLVPENGSLFDSTIWYWHGPSKSAFPAGDVLHYRPQVSYDGLVGYSPELMFSPIFTRAQMLEVYQTKYLRNGSMIRGSIEFPAGTTKEQAAEIINTVKQFRASTGERDIIALFGGAKLTNTTISPVDSQLSEQDSNITKKIAQITGVPQRLLMDTSDTKYNAAEVEAIGQDVVRFCFRPRLELVEAELSTKLLTEDEQDSGLSIRLDTSALIRGDTAVEMTVATQGVAGGLLTKNEGRTQIGEPAVTDPSADKLLVPTHVATVENPGASEAETHSAEPAPDHYEAFMPLLEDAAARVESKTDKALQTAAKKTEGERIPYTNALAESQGNYAVVSIAPIATAIKSITGKKLDIAKIGERYSAEIRRRAAGEAPKDLISIVGDQINAAA